MSNKQKLWCGTEVESKYAGLSEHEQNHHRDLVNEEQIVDLCRDTMKKRTKEFTEV